MTKRNVSSKNASSKKAPVTAANRKAAAKTEAKKEAPKELTAKQKARQAMLARTVSLEVVENPKRDGSKARDRFAFYQDGMTVKEFLEAGGTMGDIYHDQGHGFITLS